MYCKENFVLNSNSHQHYLERHKPMPEYLQSYNRYDIQRYLAVTG
jgi:hypothetical protein